MTSTNGTPKSIPVLSGDRKLINKVPQMMETFGLTKKDINRAVVLAGYSWDTAYRLMKGETGFQIETLADIANVLGIAIEDMFTLVDKGDE